MSVLEAKPFAPSDPWVKSLTEKKPVDITTGPLSRSSASDVRMLQDLGLVRVNRDPQMTRVLIEHLERIGVEIFLLDDKTKWKRLDLEKGETLPGGDSHEFDVAVKPDDLLLPVGSFDSPMQVVQRVNHSLPPRLAAFMGEVADYLVLDLFSREKTGKSIFPAPHKHVFTQSNSDSSHFLTIARDRNPNHLLITTVQNGRLPDYVHVLPLIAGNLGLEPGLGTTPLTPRR